MMAASRVVVVDDHALVRAGIRQLVESIEGVVVVAESGDGREAVALAGKHRPDVVLLDISMKELNGIDATLQIKAESPETRVLILSMHNTEDFVRRAIKAGASGYLVKDCAPAELGTAIEAILRGQIYLSPSISKHLVSGLLNGYKSEVTSNLDDLTPRQREILQMVAEGKSTKKIAFTLDVSVKTVETHRSAIMNRLDIHDIAGLVLFAVRNGLVDIGDMAKRG